MHKKIYVHSHGFKRIYVETKKKEKKKKTVSYKNKRVIFANVISPIKFKLLRSTDCDEKKEETGKLLF